MTTTLSTSEIRTQALAAIAATRAGEPVARPMHPEVRALLLDVLDVPDPV